MIRGLKIGLIGKMRSGKDTVAARLVERYGFKRFAFGDELKRYAHEIFNVKSDAKPRELYQQFGQLCRSIDPDVWIRKAFDKIAYWQYEMPDEYDRIVISDVRQPNEVKRCMDEGFYLIRVNCPTEIRKQRMIEAGDQFTDADLEHETEMWIDSYRVDFEIDNSGKLTDTFEQLDVIMREIFAREWLDDNRRL